MAALTFERPALTFATLGQEYPAISNHFGLSFCASSGGAAAQAEAASSSAGSRWQCWEVEAQWPDLARSEAPGSSAAGRQGRADGVQRRPPGKARCQAALGERLASVPELQPSRDGGPSWVYDGARRLYTRASAEWSGLLPPGADDDLAIRVERCTTRESAAQEIDLSKLGECVRGDCTEELRFVQVFIRQQAGLKPGHVALGRRVFIEKSAAPWYLRSLPQGDIVQGRTMWLGYLASLERSIGDLPLGSDGCVQLNVNITAGFGIPEQQLQHFIGVLSSGKQEDSDNDQLHSFWKPWDRKWHSWMAETDDEHWQNLKWLNAEQFGIKNVTVITTYMPRSRNNSRSIRGVSSKPPHALWFKVDGSWTNVHDYFQQKHGIQLQHPSLPCVDLGKGDQHVWIPIELVRVRGGLHNITRKVSEQMLDTLVRRLAVSPDQRLEWIQQVLWDVPDLRALGVQVDWSPKQLTLRRLPAPALRCGAQRGNARSSQSGVRDQIAKGTLVFADGFYNPNDARAVSPPRGQVKWLILNYVRDFKWEDLTVLRDEIVRVAGSRGADFEPNPWIEERRDDRAETSQTLRLYLHQYAQRLHLLVALLPQKSAVYGQLKDEAQILGLHTACLNPPKTGAWTGRELARKKVPMFVNGILTKLGTLAQLEYPSPLLSTGTMALGIDVRHEDGAASIAGAAATFAPSFTHYRWSCRAQLPRLAQEGERQRLSKEHVEDLEGMVAEILQHWRKENPDSPWPGQVLVFRDGVSEGQFAKQTDEIWSLLRAFEAKGAPVPKVAWIVVQKRHHTRLAPGKGAPRLKNGNVVPGVVADRGIAHPLYENWFAVSHKAIQGTAVPAHYFLLYNSLGASKDELIEVTNQMCHLYPRASCAVSYPTPAYYADHLCERGYLLGVGVRGYTDCDQLNTYFRGPEFASSLLQGTNCFC